jgi:receptor-binding and translocation channel-forming TcA subunit of Tc toxin/ABC toxin-like protein
MSYLLVVRIVPQSPVAPADFTNYLTNALGNLQITAYDLSYGNVDNPPPGPGAVVGTATYVAATAPPNATSPPGNPLAPIIGLALPLYTPPAYPAGLTSGIVQQWDTVPNTGWLLIGGVLVGPGSLAYGSLESVATALMELNPPSGTALENLRLVAQWGAGAGAQPIPVISDFYQLELLPPPAGWQDPNSWPGFTPNAYIQVPAPPPAASPYSVTVPDDGSPPAFDSLLAAIRAALVIDPGGAAPNLATLTIDQCRNLAYEITWAQQPPIPVPPTPDKIEDLYSNPPNTGGLLGASGGSTTPNQLEGDRQQFEGNLKKYYSTADATADRLTSFIVAVSRAIACEAQSIAATEAQIKFPANPGVADPLTSNEVSVTLTAVSATFGPAGFGVPAAYFYALASLMPSQMTAQQRYQLATGEKIDRILAAFTAAINVRTITDAESFATIAGSCNAAQAARRLSALSVSAQPDALAPLGATPTVAVPYPAPLGSIVTDWLAFPPTPATQPSSEVYQPDDDITQFWPNEATLYPDQNGFLNLVLCALTKGYVIPAPFANPLGFQICTTLAVANVAQLAAITTQQWTGFFRPNPTWLPPFTQPGNTEARISAFIRYFERFFAATSEASLDSIDLALQLPVAAGTNVLTFASTAGVTAGMTVTCLGHIPAGTTVLGPPTPTMVTVQLPPGLTITPAIPALTNITFTPSYPSSGTTTLPLLPLPSADPIRTCLATYGAVVFGTGFNLAALQAAAATVLPGDAEAQSWLVDACQTIDHLYAVLKYPPTPVVFPLPPTMPPPSQDNLLFSCAEALYARGFTSAADITELSATEFPQAMIGTIAYDVAGQIYNNAAAISPPLGGGAMGGGTFVPINPDGTLTDCIPPGCLSPLGPIAYLHEMLEVSENSTCAQPLDPTSPQTLGAAVRARRGPIGDLAASCGNLDTQLPVVDLVNECLEFMGSVAAPSAGVVYDTSEDALAGHELCDTECCGPDEEDSDCHEPDKIFAAIPEYSTPGIPVAANSAIETAVYQTLRSDLSNCCLPYSQPLDVSRTCLRHFRSCRFEEMRTFRRCITEFVLDPIGEPAGFQSHLWRYPVRIDIAIEYLGITPEEYRLVFGGSQIRPCGARPDDRMPPPEAGGFDLREFVNRQVTAERGQPRTGLPQFLQMTCLTYCEFLELWKSGFVPFSNGQDPNGVFPDCEPCCLDDYWLSFPPDPGAQIALWQLTVFVRLWRKLRVQCCEGYGFDQLRDICDVLHLFNGTALNPDFIRQLAAFQILRDRFCLPLADRAAPPAPGAVDAARTQLLSLWVGPTAAKWRWAVQELLEHVSRDAEHHYRSERRTPEFLKILASNLDGLSRLAGFDPGSATDHWHALPTHTLRFAEVLSKLHATRFSIEEIFYLFTADAHLDGDDPFELQEDNEALDLPLGLPDDDAENSLWRLRERLLAVRPERDGEDEWHWKRLSRTLREDLGFAEADVLAFGQHFFPSVLEHAGTAVPLAARRYTSPLAGGATVPAMWNTPPDGPFRYDATATPQVLWTEVPFTDRAVIEKLMHVRSLNPSEQQAVQDLYFQPRAELARFALLFTDFEAAQRHLIEERDEHARWDYFRRQVAICHERCRLIGEHLAHHVARVTHTEAEGLPRTARLILRRLYADENFATSSWENDSGQTPPVTWTMPAGGAFAALLGLLGTGLVGEFSDASGAVLWRDTTGRFAPFGPERNRENCPVPTVLPALDLTLTPAQLQFISVRNGFALRDATGTWLGGGEGFQIRWSGALLIEREGGYEFLATEPAREGEEREHGVHARQRYRVTLKRGQRTWVLLSHHFPGEPDQHSSRLPLRRGAYELEVELVQPAPSFSDEEQVHRMHTGLELSYSGPDTEQQLAVIPRERLFCTRKDAPLGADITPASPGAGAYLNQRYVGSLRDIRRTYQRAFKALLFAHRLGLTATPNDDHQSELGYMLEQAGNFAGLAYYRAGGAFQTHAADLDFNLLPLLDPYLAPTTDARAAPSLQRRQALFDWWERLYDYGHMRAAVRGACGREVWPLFAEALQLQVAGPAADPHPLLRHLCADARHWVADLSYFQNPSSAVYAVSMTDLEDDRWVVRAWHADQWMRALGKCFCCKDITEARPDLWAADDPSATLPHETESGNTNLTRFLDDGCLEAGDPRRYEDLRRLNDGLRERGRMALISYLCAMNRVALPWAPGQYARRPRDLSDLLLLDVEAGICERVSRIDNAISAVQTFIQRARLQLEPGWTVSAAFARLWDRQFASFCVWRDCKRRHLYKENFIEWLELERARGVEAFRLLESKVGSHVLTAPRATGLAWWPDETPPAHPTMITLQDHTPATFDLLTTPREGLELLAAPDWGGRPEWVSAIQAIAPSTQSGAGAPGGALTTQPVPYWIEAAIKMGTTFLRIAAGGVPVASGRLKPHHHHGPEDCVDCCRECGCVHPQRVDEYYFWLVREQQYDPPPEPNQVASPTAPDNYQFGYQDDFYNQNQQQSAYWQDETQLQQLLDWQPKPVVRLAWCRVHNGRFLPVRRSPRAIEIDPSQSPDLFFYGRMDDSLVFAIETPETPAPIPGYQDTSSAPGFRYDLATDEAVVLPTVEAAPTPLSYPGGIPAYPWFVYDEPGARLFPLWPYAPALTVACGLRLNCQFEAALKWYDLAFDPLSSDCTWIDCHADNGTGGQGSTGQDPVSIEIPGTPGAVAPSPQPVPPQGAGSACCDSTDVDCAQARDRSVLLSYLETLRDWGDALMRRDTREAYEQARAVFDTARLILGKPPRKVKLPKPVSPPPVSGFVPAFPPLNPRLLALYDLINDRLAMIHRCLSSRRLRSGKGRCEVPRFCIDRDGKGWESCGDECHDDCEDERAWCHLPSPYRFLFLVQKAVELAAASRALGAELLTAFEKGDAAYLETLRARQEREMAALAIEMRKDAWRESDWQVEVLQKNKATAQANFQYYKGLIQAGLITPEVAYQDLTIASTVLRAAGNISEAIGGAMSASGNYFDGVAGFGGSPLFYAQLPIGGPLAGLFSALARVMNALAEVTSSTAGLELTEGGWQRRSDDWLHQEQVLGIEIEQIETQILAAQRHRDQALQELNMQERQREHASELRNFLRDKFTSQDLYLHLQKETAALHRQAYDLAFDMAHKAERAFNFERGHTHRHFLPCECWDNLHEGLTAGERLELAIRAMEKAYLDENAREYELTKHFSLRQQFPREFLRLKATGRCEVEIPEWMFDLDYPGMYLRRIKSVRLTLPCVTGPYSGVHCRLTLLSSRTRVDPRLSPPVHRCCCDRRHLSEYEACVDDPRIAREYSAREAIATSSGQADPGLFELNLRDERYLPFEYFGAVSCWRIELRRENNYFDVDTLTDLVLHMNYTAREGGEALREVASADAQRHVPGDGCVILDMRRDLSVSWERFRTQRRERRPAVFETELQRSLFPFVPDRPELWVEGAGLVFRSSDRDDEECGERRQCPCPEPREPDCHEVKLCVAESGGDEERHRREGYLHCRATAEFDQLYAGELKERLGELGGEHRALKLRLTFEPDLGEVADAYLLLRYSVRASRARHCDPCRLTAAL